jgi:plasmid maintenance system antidote protein VapI
MKICTRSKGEINNMTGYNTKLAEEVRRVLNAHGKKGRMMSLRDAERRTGVSYATVFNMVDGKAKIRPDILVKFARGFGEEPGKWLELCGYDPTWNEITVDDPAAQKILLAFMRLPPAKRAQALDPLIGIFSMISEG